MKTIALIIVLALWMNIPVLCQEMPGDVPEDHYAYDAIQDLVGRGINVSQGFPDGTFMGNKNTSRYANAYFMAKLAISLRGVTSNEIDISDIREEINWLRNDIVSLETQPGKMNDLRLYGSVDLKSGFGSVLAYDAIKRAPLGPEANYRFKFTAEKTMGKDANLKMNVDTMDGGFNSSAMRVFPSRLIDVEGNLRTDIGLEYPLYLKAIVGPGSVKHSDASGVAPSEDGTYFNRPRTSFIANTIFGGKDVSFGYFCRGIAGDGRVGTSEVNLKIGGKLWYFPSIGTIEAVSTTRYAFVDLMDPSSAPNEFIQELAFSATQSKRLSQKLGIGSSSTDNPISQYYLNYELYLKDMDNDGTNITFIYNSVGEGYRQPFVDLEFVPTNLFDRKIQDGMIDIGLEITRPLGSRLTMKSRSDWVGSSKWKMAADIPGASFTQELTLDYIIDKGLTFNSFYRYYHVPSRIDQFNSAVPEVSDLVGLELSYRF